jgi:hypothetical protein
MKKESLYEIVNLFADYRKINSNYCDAFIIINYGKLVNGFNYKKQKIFREDNKKYLDIYFKNKCWRGLSFNGKIEKINVEKIQNVNIVLKDNILIKKQKVV